MAPGIALPVTERRTDVESDESTTFPSEEEPESGDQPGDTGKQEEAGESSDTGEESGGEESA